MSRGGAGGGGARRGSGGGAKGGARGGARGGAMGEATTISDPAPSSPSIIGGGGGAASSSSVLTMSVSGLNGQLGTTGGGTALPKLELLED